MTNNTTVGFSMTSNEGSVHHLGHAQGFPQLAVYIMLNKISIQFNSDQFNISHIVQ